MTAAPSEGTPPESMSTRKFRESLGTEYSSRYDAATIAAHAKIAARRGTVDRARAVRRGAFTAITAVLVGSFAASSLARAPTMTEPSWA